MYERSIVDFADQIEAIETADGRNARKEKIANIADESVWRQKIHILSGKRFDDIGIARKTAIDAVARAYRKDESVVEADVAEEGSVTEAVREYWTTGQGSVAGSNDAVDDLFATLESIEQASGDRQIQLFTKAIRDHTVPWVVVFAVLYDLSIGVSHSTICSAVGEDHMYSSKEIRRARALITDTVEFVEAVKNGEMIDKPEVGTAFKPMKAKSSGAPDDLEDWTGQIKLDGYRCIIHVQSEDEAESEWGMPGRRVRAFSASMNEQTEKLPELEAIDWPDGEWIFDAEVMADDGEYGSTSERMQRKGSSELPHTMNFWLFDVLIADGEDLTRTPFEDRMDQLIESAPMDERVIPVFAHDDVEAAREDALENGYEGIILKSKDHEFEFGKRSKDWIKEKITTETVDLRIAWFAEGEGRHANSLGAVAVETEDGTPMGKVGTGFTDRTRQQIWDNRDEWRGEIIEIKFDADDGYEDGLRFPAFVRRRTDKLEADDEQRVRNIAGGS